MNLIAKRHDHKRSEVDPQTGSALSPPYPDARGNVLFVDGHVAFTRRDYVVDPAHYRPQL